MNFFSRPKSRSPVETVRSLKENVVRLDSATSVENRKRVSGGNLNAHTGRDED